MIVSGGWDPTFASGAPDFGENLNEEIDQAFKNVDLALRDAGGNAGHKFSELTRMLPIFLRVTTALSKTIASGCRIIAQFGPRLESNS